MQRNCPKCNSSNVKVIEEEGIFFIVCNSCGYDELEADFFPEDRSSQREKNKFSPYKTGGKE
ncbi:MAG: hypothetical protein AABW48_04920 [Nanoarchaeota archaeon]